jgi:toxin ParE1/3/4
MVKVIWTSQAYNDLKEIYDFIAIDSQKLAVYMRDKIYERTLILRTFPSSGRVVPEIKSPAIRELIEGKYRIVYEIIDEQVILIQAVRHGSRNFDVEIN